MEEKKKLKRIVLSFAILVLFSMTPHLNTYNLRGEEAKRLITAFEISKTGDLLNLTYLGDIYLNKPPLFYWLAIASSKIFGWDVITIRALSIIFTFATAIAIYFFSKHIFRDEKVVVFSTISFLTFFDVLFWYGWIGEIDATFTFFIFMMFIFQYLGFVEKKTSFIVLSGIFAGLSFLLKGLPAYLFFGVNFIVMALFYRRLLELFKPVYLISYFFAIFIPSIWILSTVKPIELIKTLLYESTQRVKKDSYSLLKHLFSYPLTNIKQTLPASVFFLYLLIRKKIVFNSTVKLFILIIFVNYIPYWISAGSHGRYILPLFPIFAILCGYAIANASLKLQKIFLFTALFFIILRLIAGMFLVPYIMKKDGNVKEVSFQIASLIDDGKIACNCEGSHKAICFFVEVYKDKILKLPSSLKDWDYLIACKSFDGGELIKTFIYRRTEIKLYKRRTE